MDIFDVQDMMNSTFPGKKVDYEFSVECHRIYEIIMSDGKLNDTHHIECRKVKVMVEGDEPKYINIAPHRIAISSDYLKKVLSENVLKA